MSLLRSILSLGLFAALVGVIVAAERSSASMAAAATRFLDSLPPDQRQAASFAVDSDELTHWNFIPNEVFPRKGVTIKALTEPQRALARELLKTGLSQRGYLTATTIMDLENVLRALEHGTTQFPRDPEMYYFSVFGTPSPRGTWAWRVEGHHISLHFTIVNGTMITGSPTFFGSNPGEVREGPKKGLRILAQEEDAGRALLLALNAEQRAKATIDAVAPKEIVTNNAVKADPLSPAGIPAASLDAKQRDLLMRLIDAYTSHMAGDLAADRLAKLRKAGFEKIAFAWAGEAEPGRPHYYRIQGPTFLVEYDNTQNNANHIHTVWRDFDGDFGRDLLREHLKSMPH